MKILRDLPVLSLLFLLACGGGSGSDSSSTAKAPKNLTFPVDEAVFLLGVPIVPLTPSVDGGVTNWKVSPALPPGLALNAADGTLEGRPTAASAETTYVVTASNGGGKATAQIRIRTSPTSRWLYTADITADTISAFGIDALTGQLFPRGHYDDPAGFPLPEEVIVHPTLPFLYVPNLRDAANPSDISIFPIDGETGELGTPLTPVPVGKGPHSLRFHPNGQFAYVSSNGSDEVRVFAVDMATGELSLVSIASTGNGPWNLTVDPFGRFVFVADRLDSTISIFKIDPTTGDLAPSIVFDTNASRPNILLAHPEGEYLVAVLENVKLLISFMIDPVTGDLSTVNAVPIPAEPASAILHPSGEAIYLVTRSDDALSVFPFDPETGTISPSGGALPVGDDPSSVTLDEAGFTALVTCGKSDEVVLFDLVDDLFTPNETSRKRSRQGPRAPGIYHGVAPIQPRAQALYCLNKGDEDVSAFKISAADSSLTFLSDSNLTGAVPTALAVDPLGRFVYVALRSPDTIEIFDINAGTFGLSSTGSAQTVGADPEGIAINANGRVLYATNMGADQVESFSMNATTGILTKISDIATGDGPGSIALDPTEQFLYVANETDSEISAFRVSNGTFLGSSTGASTPAGSKPTALRFSRSGAHLLVAVPETDEILVFDIDHDTGALSPLAPGAAAASEPRGLAIHPTLERAYGALYDPSAVGGIATYSLDPATGLASHLDTLAVGLNPYDLVLDPLGEHLFAANRTGSDISVFDLSETGDVSESSSALTGQSPTALGLRIRF